MKLDFLDSFDFFVGVPDSQLQALCNYLMHKYGVDGKHHIIAANEGNALALAAGYHLSTGKVPVVYLQNSGIGNIVNPVASLMNDKVYAMPCLFVVGWRGEPGIHDEPQHIFQGEITLSLLKELDIDTFVIDKTTTEDELNKKLIEWQPRLAAGKQVALVVRKGALSFENKITYKNDFEMKREEVISHIVKFTGNDPIVSTTGKASRELFEIREANKQSHKYDFLTVGSMGHSSSIAFGIAINKPDTKVWCVDGDGAALMHLGAMGVIGANKPKNLVHIVINNGAHESVGGMPTVADEIDLCQVAEGCGYENILMATDFDTLDKALGEAKNANALTFIEVKCAIGARDDLGRPTTTAIENKNSFMEFLKNI